MDISTVILIGTLLYCVYLYKQHNLLYIECLTLRQERKHSEYNEKQNNMIIHELKKMFNYIQEKEECKDTFVDVIGFNTEQILNHKIEREKREIEEQEEVVEIDSIPSRLSSLGLD